jgi:hypothetical protein
MTTEQDAGTTNISLSLRVPQDSIEQFTDTEQTQLATQLSEALHDDVAVDLRLIPVTRVASSQTHL